MSLGVSELSPRLGCPLEPLLELSDLEEFLEVTLDDMLWSTCNTVAMNNTRKETAAMFSSDNYCHSN